MENTTHLGVAWCRWRTLWAKWACQTWVGVRARLMMWPAKPRQLPLASQVGCAKPCLRATCCKSLFFGVHMMLAWIAWWPSSLWGYETGGHTHLAICTTSFPFSLYWIEWTTCVAVLSFARAPSVGVLVLLLICCHGFVIPTSCNVILHHVMPCYIM